MTQQKCRGDSGQNGRQEGKTGREYQGNGQRDQVGTHVEREGKSPDIPVGFAGYGIVQAKCPAFVTHEKQGGQYLFAGKIAEIWRHCGFFVEAPPGFSRKYLIRRVARVKGP